MSRGRRTRPASSLLQVQHCFVAVVFVGKPTAVALEQTGFLVPVLEEALLAEALLLELVEVALLEKTIALEPGPIRRRPVALVERKP